MNTPLGMLLVVISGICWSAVYVDSIRNGFKQKTHCMPLFALGLNIAWEGIYAYYEMLGRGSVSLQKNHFLTTSSGVVLLMEFALTGK